jgi:hypothetical protein
MVHQSQHGLPHQTAAARTLPGSWGRAR